MALAINDFNIAVCADAEPTISASSGTSGSWAPDVSAGRSYSPGGHASSRSLQTPCPLRETMRSLRALEPSLRPPVPDVPNLCPQEMGGLLNPSIRLTASGHVAPQDPDRDAKEQQEARIAGLNVFASCQDVNQSGTSNWTCIPFIMQSDCRLQHGRFHFFIYPFAIYYYYVAWVSLSEAGTASLASHLVGLSPMGWLCKSVFNWMFLLSLVIGRRARGQSDPANGIVWHTSTQLSTTYSLALGRTRNFRTPGVCTSTKGLQPLSRVEPFVQWLADWAMEV